MKIVSILFVMIIATPTFAEKPIVTKEGMQLPAGLTCYDDAGAKAIDNSQKIGLRCLVDLKKSEQENTALKSLIPNPDVPINNYPPRQREKVGLSKIIIGVVVGIVFGEGLAHL